MTDHKPAECQPEWCGRNECALFTREQVSAAINAGADLVRDGLDLGDRDADIINLVVNAACYALDTGYKPTGNGPAGDLDDAINAQYENDGPGEFASAAEMVRSWWDFS